MHVIAPVRAVRRQPNRLTNMLVTGPRANIQAIPTEPTQAVKEKHFLNLCDQQRTTVMSL